MLKLVIVQNLYLSEVTVELDNARVMLGVSDHWIV